jgi:hypothetical protein
MLASLIYQAEQITVGFGLRHRKTIRFAGYGARRKLLTVFLSMDFIEALIMKFPAEIGA